MTLQNTFYLFAILFFISLIGLNIYLVILVKRLKENAEKLASNVKRTAENVNLARYSMKAMVLKTFLNFLNPKGGDDNE